MRSAQPAEFVGLENYTFLLGDDELWARFIFTGRFVVLSVALQFAIGISVAYGLQKNFRGRDVLFTAVMMPMMVCPIVVVVSVDVNVYASQRCDHQGGGDDDSCWPCDLVEVDCDTPGVYSGVHLGEACAAEHVFVLFFW